MPATAEVRCGCGTNVIVFTLHDGVVPVDIEQDFIAHTRDLETEAGKRFAVADDAGSWTCPSCGQSNVAPVDDLN